jgi:hypothetical protein
VRLALDRGLFKNKMLTRRQLLMRGTTLLALVPIVPAFLQACSSGGGGGTGDDVGGGPDTCTDGSYSVSTTDDMHSHSLCIPNADLTNPPAAGQTYLSSDNGAHTHKITLTAAQLATIASGGTVTVLSSNDLDPLDNMQHTHSFKIAKATAATPQPPAPTGW